MNLGWTLEFSILLKLNDQEKQTAFKLTPRSGKSKRIWAFQDYGDGGHNDTFVTNAFDSEIFPLEEFGDYFDAGVALYASRKKTASRILLNIFS